MAWLLLAVGLVLIVEGLVYALAPQAVEELLELLRTIPVETRRQVGLLVLALGMVFTWAGYALIQAVGG